MGHETLGGYPKRAFTLIELMIVVGIIAIVAAIAVPNLLSSRQSGNEVRAIGYLKSWTPAQEFYKKKHDNYASADEDLVNDDLIPPPPNGYTFQISTSPNPYYWAGTADPVVHGTTGTRYFFLDSGGVIRFDSLAPATRNSPPIGH